MCNDVLADPELLEALVEAMYRSYLTSGRRMGKVVTVLLDEDHQTKPAAISPSPPAGRGHPFPQRN